LHISTPNDFLPVLNIALPPFIHSFNSSTRTVLLRHAEESFVSGAYFFLFQLPQWLSPHTIVTFQVLTWTFFLSPSFFSFHSSMAILYHDGAHCAVMYTHVCIPDCV